MNIDKVKGCLIGGAIGDALGYPFEFIKDKNLNSKIEYYSLKNGLAEISDDTQLTLFTICGLIDSAKKGNINEVVNEAYKVWYDETENTINTDSARKMVKHYPKIREMRTPGFSTLNALEWGGNGTIDNPINDSKGNGGVMRIAPVGLFFSHKADIKKVAEIGAEISALTHGHELSHMSAYFLTYILAFLCSVKEKSLEELDTIIDIAKIATKIEFKKSKFSKDFVKIIDKAVKLSKSNKDDSIAIKELGEGWVAEESVAIAVYCLLKYGNNFEKCVLTAVNCSADRDTVGSITGNLVGCNVGFNKISEKFLENLECEDIILEMSEKLYEMSKN